MTMRSVSRAAVAVVAGLVMGACGGKDPVQPVSGDLTVSYTGPSQTDGALLVTVTGAVTGVKAIGNYQVASASLGPTSTRVVVTGDLAVGDVFKISVADVATVATYTAAVEAAADRATYALDDPSDYHVTIRK